MSTCSTMLNLASARPGTLDKKETAEVEGLRTELTGLTDGEKAARENLAGARKTRQDCLDGLHGVLTASKGLVQCHSSLKKEPAPLTRLGYDSTRVKGVLSVVDSYRKVLESAAGDPLTKKVLADLDANTKAFVVANDDVVAKWAAYKSARTAAETRTPELARKVSCIRNVLMYRLPVGEARRFGKMLSTGKTRARTGAEPKATVTPAATTTQTQQAA